MNKKAKNSLIQTRKNIRYNRIYIALTCFAFVLIIDNLLFGYLFAGAFTYQLTSNVGLFMYLVIVLASCILGQYVLKTFTNEINNTLEIKNTSIRFIYKNLTKFAFYFIVSILGLMSLQLLLTSYYNAVFLFLSIAISFIFSGVLFLILSFKFFYWYRSSHNPIFLLYTTTFAILTFGLFVIAIFNNGIILSKFIVVNKYAQLKIKPFDNIQGGNSPFIIIDISYFPFHMSFILLWISTTSLLHHYSKKIGKLKFWILASLPLTSFITGILFVDGVLKINFYLNSVSLYILLLFSVIVGGFFFGLVFLVTARSIKYRGNQTDLVRHLYVSAFGIFLLNVSYSVVVIYAPYPPFGTACLSFGVIASVLFSYGFYSSAAFISQDNVLRRLIRDIALRESSKLIGDIGRAEMANELTNRIFLQAKESNLFFNRQIDFQNHVTEDNIKQYLNELFEELNNNKKKF